MCRLRGSFYKSAEKRLKNGPSQNGAWSHTFSRARTCLGVGRWGCHAASRRAWVPSEGRRPLQPGSVRLSIRFAAVSRGTRGRPKKLNSRNANRHGTRLDEWSSELTVRILAACAVDEDRCQVYPQRVPSGCSTTNYIAASIIAKLQHKTLTVGACTNTVDGCD